MSSNDSKNTILQDYYAELEYAKQMKAQGVTQMAAFEDGVMKNVNIDACISRWQDGITAMEAGADQEQFNY